MPSDIWPAITLIKENDIARAAFDVIKKNLGISGYAIARQLDKNPAEVQDALSSLREKKIIASGSVELRDNFTLTGTGFQLKQYLD
ncbi:MAG TPA: hypothetical protein VK530_08955 [Candidatus Acidoferrum sp.]|nr:hypothetical protein [Candidatus Acidoferrum sp.]